MQHSAVEKQGQQGFVQEALSLVRELKQVLLLHQQDGWSGVPLVPGKEPYTIPIPEKRVEKAQPTMPLLSQHIAKKDSPFPQQEERKKRFVPTPAKDFTLVRNEPPFLALQSLPEGELQSRKQQLTELEQMFSKTPLAEKYKAPGRQHFFGEGSVAARVFVLKESPSFEESLLEGEHHDEEKTLIQNMLRAIHIQPQEAYIAPLVKIRRDEKRTKPSREEVEICGDFVREQISLIKPDVILALGLSASRFLVPKDGFLQAFRGSWHNFYGCPVLTSFHPLYLLRTPREKRKAWEDLSMVLEKLRSKPVSQES